MTGKTGWSVVVLSHHPVHWYGYMPNVLTILEAYVAGTSGNVSVAGTSIPFNFSGKNTAKLIGTFHGHTHNLIHGKMGNALIPRIGTPNGCFSRNNEYGSSSYNEDFRAKYGETTTYSKTANSARDTAFCVYTIDTVSQVIYATCYGAGYDRTVSYGDAAYYSITNNLASGVTSNNTATSIKEGSSYSATLTAANAGYSINNVVVKMGGVDITASAYANGVINISNVTGDIVITATVSGYTNIIDIIGYTDNTRLSTSAGNTKAETGYVTTGFIDLRNYSTPIVIRTKGVDFRASTHGNSAYVWYSASQAFFSSSYLDNKDDSSLKTEFDGEGNLTFTIKRFADTNPLIRLAGYGSGADLIMTINEEITNDSSDNGGDNGGSDVVNYTNLVPTSIGTDGSVYNGVGYKADYRLNSSGTETSLTGAICSGFIPYNNEVIRAWGCTASTVGSTGNYLALYDSSFTKIYVGQFKDAFNGTYEEYNGKYLMTIDPSTISNATYKSNIESAKYIRVGFASCAPSDFVVTLNEEII
jgi:hypothetical protein